VHHAALLALGGVSVARRRFDGLRAIAEVHGLATR